LIAVARERDRKLGQPLKNLRQDAVPVRRRVDDDEHAGGQRRGKPFDDRRYGLQATCRGADDDDCMFGHGATSSVRDG
jgi:hypothetical protein